jgi:hypothetical protein
MKAFVGILFFFFTSYSLFSQEIVKNEVEKRISQSEFSTIAYDLIQSQLSDAKRIKYYIEVDGADTSYEVKFFKNEHLYSVEFSSIGVFEDIEKKVDSKELPANIGQNIRSYFIKNYRKHKIRKVQVQYKSQKVSSNNLEKLFEGYSNLFETSYEIEVAVKDVDGTSAMYEFHFDANGKFLDKRKFKQQGDDNILY